MDRGHKSSLIGRSLNLRLKPTISAACTSPMHVVHVYFQCVLHVHVSLLEELLKSDLLTFISEMTVTVVAAVRVDARSVWSTLNSLTLVDVQLTVST